MMPDSCDDASLLRGDPDAFAGFYRRHEDDILRFFLRRTASPELAADLTAETFASCLAGRSRFDPARGDARGWLFGIARKLLMRSIERGSVEDAMRVRLRMEPIVLDDRAIDLIEALDDRPATFAMRSLPHDQRVAVQGRILEEEPYAALAERLRCSESVVRKRVSRALTALRTEMEERL